MHTLTSGKVSLSLTVFCVSAAIPASLLLCVSAARSTSQAWPDPSRLRMGQETLVLSSCRSGMCTTQ